jgi:hypothetical protein
MVALGAADVVHHDRGGVAQFRSRPVMERLAVGAPIDAASPWPSRSGLALRDGSLVVRSGDLCRVEAGFRQV